MSSGQAPSIPRSRLITLAVILSIGFGIIVFQLVNYQLVKHEELTGQGEAQRAEKRAVRLPRGVILDANGYSLALDSTQWEITASPILIMDADETSTELASILNRPKDEIYQKLIMKDKDWVFIERYAPLEAGEAVLDLGNGGLICEPMPVRVYPCRSLAPHLVGIVTSSGDGWYGVEGYYNQILKGSTGEEEIEHDSAGAPLPLPAEIQRAALEGTSLRLTIDINIQFIAQEQLLRALEEYGAESGTVIIMDPKTGAILADVSYPSYDPNEYADADVSAMADPAVSSMWEPGSIFKIITWSAGLDTGTISPGTTFYDDGAMEVGGRVIRNWDRMGHGLVTMNDGLVKSLNTVASFISTSVGKDQFYTYLRRFGFGSITNVDLASEGPGMVKLPGDANWFPSELGTNSFGQGVAVTPIQMITAVAAVANRGLLMKPYIVSEFIKDYGKEQEQSLKPEPTIVRRAISEQTAAIMTDLLENVVENGATKAQVPGYRIAGKTGTAQIPTAYGYHPTDTIGSFIGFAPADDPRFIVLIKLDKPTASPWGSQTAAPTFRAIAQKLFVYMHIPPDDSLVAQSAAGQ